MTQNNLFNQNLNYPSQISNIKELDQAIMVAEKEAIAMLAPKNSEKRIRGHMAHIIFQKYFPGIHSFKYWQHRYKKDGKSIDYCSTKQSWRKKPYGSNDGHADLKTFLTEITQLVPTE